MEYANSSTSNLEGLQPLTADFCLAASFSVCLFYTMLFYLQQAMNVIFKDVFYCCMSYCCVILPCTRVQCVAFVEPVARKFCNICILMYTVVDFNCKFYVYGSSVTGCGSGVVTNLATGCERN